MSSGGGLRNVTSTALPAPEEKSPAPEAKSPAQYPPFPDPGGPLNRAPTVILTPPRTAASVR
ncbi:hypothetical protein Val02_07870 [Virgisporangium aliadipatigenens]|uniref:Uncharacterized protein n=1 Tax=Virgisporangium aliadipatigenens TaxID=741659 RepID=A0A8J4DNK1_9ACTN|nr:hypothetical protein Val02_07870 [Virgisporangium aliadipatigenens]